MPAKLVIFSDGKFGPVAGFELGNLEPVFVPIGEASAANVGIMAFSIGRSEPSRAVPGIRPIAEFRPGGGYGQARVVPRRRSERRRPGGDCRRREPKRALPVAAVEEGVLRLAITVAGDQLACDNEAWAVLSTPRRSKVLLVTSGNEPLELALGTKAAAELADVRSEGPDFLKTKSYKDLAASGGFDLVIYDRCRPQQMPRANTLFIGSLPPEGGWKAKPKTAAPQIIDAELSHPLLQWLDLGDVLLAEGTPLGPPPGGSVLVDTDAGPMLAIAPRESFEDVVMGFVLVDQQPGPGGKTQRFIGTNWPIRVSFSSFALNLLSYLGGHGQTPESATVRPGSSVTLESPDPQATVEVHTPSGQTVSPAAGRFRQEQLYSHQ